MHAVSLMRRIIADVCMLILLYLEEVTELNFLCSEASHEINLTICFMLSLCGQIKIQPCTVGVCMSIHVHIYIYI